MVMKYLREFGASLVVVVVFSLVVSGCVQYFTSEAEAGFTASPVAWDSTFENDPDNTDSVSLGDDHIRQVKQELRGRLETELDFGTAAGGSDHGRLREGAARVFFQDATPTGIAVADDDASTALDQGRLWVDSNNDNLLQAYDSAFENVNVQPTSADAGAALGPVIILDRGSASAADADIGGGITFRGNDDAGTPADHDYAQLYVTFDDTGAGSGDGELTFRTSQADTMTTIMQLDTAALFTTANAGTLVTLTSTEAGAGVGPSLDIFRDSSSPADADVIGAILFSGEEVTSSTKQTYAEIRAVIDDQDNGSPDGQLQFLTMQADTLTAMVTLDTNFVVASANFDIATAAGGAQTIITSTNADAGSGPNLLLHRDSASPAVSDIIGQVLFRGEDDGSATTDYASLRALVSDPTNDSEDGQLLLRTMQAGTLTTEVTLDTGVLGAAATGGTQGSGTANFTALYDDGVQLFATRVTSMYWGASGMSSDATQCADPLEATINSGPKLYTIICTDNDASLFGGSTVMPDGWNAGTVTFELSYIQTAANTSALNVDVSAQCHAPGETIDGTFGTEVAIDDAAVSGSNKLDSTTSAAVTAAGTCAAGDILFWEMEVDATGTTTAMATLHFVGVKLEYTWTPDDS